MQTIKALALAVAMMLSITACGEKAPTPVAPKTETAAPKGNQAAVNVGSIFPPGEGREMVLNTCGACHPLVCAARGQRTAERWDSIHKSHQDKLTGQTAANVAKIFAYLKQNFNETKPEPQVPAELAEQGCSPF